MVAHLVGACSLEPAVEQGATTSTLTAGARPSDEVGWFCQGVTELPDLQAFERRERLDLEVAVERHAGLGLGDLAEDEPTAAIIRDDRLAGLPVRDKRVEDRYVTTVRQVQPESEHGKSLTIEAGGTRGPLGACLT
jgi:hypothetical protein